VKTFILDACAIIAYLSEEPGYEKVAKIYRMALENKAYLAINIINLLEVYYDVFRDHGEISADHTYQNILASKVNIIEHINYKTMKIAGRLKAHYKISLADSIALATSIEYNATLVTADHHELDEVEKNREAKFLWIR